MTDEEKKKLHTETINNHLKYVREMCNLMGIPQIGKEHDLSKFSPEEFDIYKWADGKMSPHDAARAELGVSPSWIHHKAKNPHHWEFWCISPATMRWLNNPCNPNYWLDFNEATPNGDGTFTIVCRCVKMPYDRVVEMFCDFVGAGKAYSKEAWTQETPWNYWINKCEGKRAMHPSSEYLIKKLLWNLHEYGLDKFIDWYNSAKDYLKDKYEKNEVDY